jgi:hypothetical protein
VVTAAQTSEAAAPFYVVEEVVGERKVAGLWQYRVRWAGYGQEDDSWEARENLRGSDVVDAYIGEAEGGVKKAAPRKPARRESRLDLESLRRHAILTEGQGSPKERMPEAQKRVSVPCFGSDGKVRRVYL